MAPSGARHRFGGWALLWLLAGLVGAGIGDGASVPALVTCNSIDETFNVALNWTANSPLGPIVSLGDGCNTLVRNHVCSPIRTSLLVEGDPGGGSIWDARFEVFQFAVEPGVTVTLRNLVLSRALVFTVGYGNMQPALFHLRAGGRLVMQNVTLQTLCSTSIYYWTQDAFFMQQPGHLPANFSGQSIFIASAVVGAVTLQNVNLTCDPNLSIPSPVDLYVHTAPMLTAFVVASNALTLPVTIHLKENITLPYVGSVYNPEQPDPRAALITTNTIITNGSTTATNGTDAGYPGISSTEAEADAAAAAASAPFTYVDANYTMSWFYVQPPARLTMRGLMLTRLRPAIWAPGIISGVMAGAMPLYMVQSSAGAASAPVAPMRMFEDVTLLVPQYEVRQVSYWCKMLAVLAPEVAPVADFLRSLVWASECDVLGESQLLLQRVRSTASVYTRVRLSSTGPPGVPFDPNLPIPSGASAYEHVQPPLFLVRTGAEWADAIAPVLPQDTWTSPPPAPQSASGTAASGLSTSSLGSSSSSVSTTGGSQLPALLLLSGTVMLSPADLGVPGGGMRVARRSAVISSMQRSCGVSNGGCSAGAVLDLGNLMDVMRLGGPNVTILFQGITLRNVSTTLTVGMALIEGASNGLRGFFNFDRSSVRIIYDTVTVELSVGDFGALYRVVATADRFKLPGGVEIRSMNSTYISMASFNFSGARGSNVEFRLLPGAAPGSTSGSSRPYGSSDGDQLAPASVDGSAGAENKTTVIVGAAVGGAVGLLLVAVLLAFCVMRRRAARRTSEGDAATGGKKVAAGGAAGRQQGSDDSAPSTDEYPTAAAAASAVGDDGRHSKACEVQLVCEHRKGFGDEEIALCTTGTVSVVTSTSDAGLPPPVPPAALGSGPGPGLPPGVGAGAALSVVSGPGQMARRVFSLARSVPEEDPLDDPEGANTAVTPTRPCSSGREEQGSAASSGSGGAGTTGSRLLDPVAPVCAGDGILGPAGGALDPPMPESAPAVGVSAAAVAGRRSVGGGPAQRSSAGAVPGAGATTTSSSSSSCRRMARMLSGGRPHGLALGESGLRIPNLRIRALGRSPSRPSRSAASSSNGPSGTLPAPTPAVLTSPECGGRSVGMMPPPQRASAGAGVGGGATLSGSSARLRSDRMQLLYPGTRHLPSCGQQREMSQGAILGGRFLCDEAAVTAAAAAGAAAAVEAVAAAGGAATTESHSTQLMATGGNFDPDSSSTGVSNSISKIPEPASEVQRLISEMAAQGTDQLVILEPIGQGGYGTVYRGVWRNLDVAVKTVLFQDRANLTPAATPMSGAAPGAASLPQSTVIRTATTEQSGEQDPQTRPASLNTSPQPGGSRSLFLNGLANQPGGATPTSSFCATITHNWALASQQQANNNSGSFPCVTLGPPAACGPLGVASQQRAVLEAAVSCSVAHPNVVATYHYDITSVRPSGVVCSGGLLVSDALRGYPGVVGLGGGVPSDWKLYLVQEFCDAGSLATALDARAFHDPAGMPNLALTLCALADIARGMVHIHSRSIVHGDLNPTNILLRTISGSNGGIVPMWNRVGVDAAGGGAGGVGGPGSGCVTPGGSVSAAALLRNELGVTLVAKVADFGLCGLLAPGKRHISNAVRGTPFYTAPETVATGTLTKASDVYSFGVIAWEVYTGRPPFQHVPEHGFVRSEAFPRLPPHVPPTFGNLTLGCLNADPDMRPTFEQILDRLMSLQSKLAVSLQQRLSRLVAGNGAGAILAAGAVCSPLGTLPPPGSLGSSPHSTLAGTPFASAGATQGGMGNSGPPGRLLAGGDKGAGSVCSSSSAIGNLAGPGGSSLVGCTPPLLGGASFVPISMPYGTHSMPSLLPGLAQGLTEEAAVSQCGATGLGAGLAPASGLVGPTGLPGGVGFANSMPHIQPMAGAHPAVRQ